MTEIMPVPRNLSFTVLPAGTLQALFFGIAYLFTYPSAIALPVYN